MTDSIGDSGLAIDEHAFFVQTKQSEFFVSSGEVALLKDKTPNLKKHKSSKNTLVVSSSVSDPGTNTEIKTNKDQGDPHHPLTLLVRPRP